ncbi:MULTISPECIES: FAD-dependent monooxygenase [Methylobacterium]|uniref:6-methylpretetramide 4-monooxygenase n=1 Tax=Methylobacterium thuringiense TaxID=1003091 RepID=A0ABQ4TLX3_9HYPH|nr:MULTISPECIES: FAD-dependent monooxygenase [Methylobacterium]TXN22985.1 pentachlorophenol monooxygenase [Methylobacterium sp. WL9]GJE55607.1 6-methylpretetramide 4-monooxygenase [Methylobacterium thuringiense]
MSLPTQTEVFVCGAGPAGLALAIGLSVKGVPFVLCDRLAEGQNTSRAAVVHARTLERLETVGVSARLVAAGNPVPTFALCAGDERLLTIDLGGLETAYPYGLIVPQDRTEAILRERLAEGGAAVNWCSEVVGIERGDVGATVAVRSDDGAVRVVRARWVIGTDGFHSTVREAARIPFAHGTYAQSFILGDVEGHWPLPPDVIALYLDAAGLMVAAPFGPGHLRIVATCDEAPEHPSLDALNAIARARGPKGARFERLIWSSRFRVHHGVAARYRDGPFLLAGDAAHVHSPAGGQGMNTGIQDALRLAELLAETIRDGRPGALDAYERERRPVAEAVVRMTDRMTRIASLTGPLSSGLRNLALRAAGTSPGIRRRIAVQLAELNA